MQKSNIVNPPMVTIPLGNLPHTHIHTQKKGRNKKQKAKLIYDKFKALIQCVIC